MGEVVNSSHAARNTQCQQQAPGETIVDVPVIIMQYSTAIIVPVLLLPSTLLLALNLLPFLQSLNYVRFKDEHAACY